MRFKKNIRVIIHIFLVVRITENIVEPVADLIDNIYCSMCELVILRGSGDGDRRHGDPKWTAGDSDNGQPPDIRPVDRVIQTIPVPVVVAALFAERVESGEAAGVGVKGSAKPHGKWMH